MCRIWNRNPKVKVGHTSKSGRYERSNILWDFQIQTDRMAVMAMWGKRGKIRKKYNKVKVVLVVIGALGAVVPKLEEWLH